MGDISDQCRIQAKLEKNPFLPMHCVIRELIREDIICNDLPQGQRLKEKQLAERFHVSRTTIRRAFEDLLAEEWLVNNEAQGVRVVELTKQKYYKLAELRLMLDAFAARLAAIHRTHQDLTTIKKYTNVSSDADVITLFHADVAFHEAIYYATNNEYLIRTYQMMGLELARTKFFSAKENILDQRERIVKEHQAIYEAIFYQEPRQAYKCAQKHAHIMLEISTNFD